MPEEKTIDISLSTIFKVIFLVISLYLLYTLKDLIIWIIFAIVISIIFNFFIDFLEKKKIPRIIAALFVYLSFFGAIGFLIYKSAPILEKEILELINNLPKYLEQLSPVFKFFGLKADYFKTLLYPNPANFAKMNQSILLALSVIFGNLFSTIFTITLAFFLSLERDIIVKFINIISPEKYRQTLISIWTRSEKRVTEWFLVRIISCFFFGLSVFIVLFLLNVPYSFLLGIAVGILDLVPYIGGIIGGGLIFFAGLTDTFIKGIICVAAYATIQFFQDHIFSPFFSKKIMGISPAVVLLALFIGEKIWGPLGAILAIPLLGILIEFLNEYFQKKEIKEIAENQ